MVEDEKSTKGMKEAPLPRGAVGRCSDGRPVYARKGESTASAIKRVCG